MRPFTHHAQISTRAGYGLWSLWADRPRDRRRPHRWPSLYMQKCKNAKVGLSVKRPYFCTFAKLKSASDRRIRVYTRTVNRARGPLGLLLHFCTFARSPSRPAGARFESIQGVAGTALIKYRRSASGRATADLTTARFSHGIQPMGQLLVRGRNAENSPWPRGQNDNSYACPKRLHITSRGPLWLSLSGQSFLQIPRNWPGS